ncbi:hypothetical protein [Thermogladius sp.]|uniref:hypothetical protein n=1 Tax=Thermogladius sp. TaxID=2023064 RepID=UPI003D0DC101
MPIGVISEVYKGSLNADLHYVFTEVNKVLTSAEGSKLSHTIDIPKPVGVESLYAMLELLVETSSPRIDWKLKVNGVNVSKEFKPAVSIRHGGRFVHKLIYDVKSVLNTPESVSKARVHMTIRHEGGGDAVLKSIGFIVAYSQSEAYTTLRQYSGLLLLDKGERFRMSELCEHGGSKVDIVAYSPAPTYVTLSNGSSTRRLAAKGLLNTQLDSEFCKVLELSNEGLSPLFVLNVLSSSVQIKRASLKVTRVTPVVADKHLSLKVEIANVGETLPDEALLIVLEKGFVRGVKRVTPPPPGGRVEEVVGVQAGQRPEVVTLRLVWKKLARTDFEDVQVSMQGV